MVPIPFANANSRPIAITKHKQPSEKPSGSITSINNCRTPAADGPSRLRKRLESKGISAKASEIMLKSRRESTTCTYASPWRKWVLWCEKQEADPIDCPLNMILDFLAGLFEQGPQYRTINGYRSAISAYHNHVNNKPVGQHPDICALLRAVDNLRPATPRYCVIWEVEKVLAFLVNMGKDDSLVDKDLTLKLTMLLSLTCLKRASELHLLNIQYMAMGETKVIFHLDNKPKHFRKRGQKPNPIEFVSSGEALCPVTTLKVYLDRREGRKL